MKRWLLLLAACGSTETPGAVDAPTTIPVDAPLPPALLTARIFPPVTPSVKQHQTFTFGVNVTNLGGTLDPDPGFTADGMLDLHNCLPIPAGGMCEYDVTETVDQLGAQSWSYSTFMPPIAGTLAATGVAPDPLAADPDAVHFGPVQLNQQQMPTRTVRLRNNASAPLGPLAIALTDDSHHFAITDSHCIGTTLAVGTICDVVVSYAPTTSPPLGSGPDNASLTITAGAQSIAVDLDGYGASLLLDPYSPTNQIQLPDAYAGTGGGSRVFTVMSFANENVGPLKVALLHTDGSPAPEISLRDDTCSGKTLSFAGTCTFGYGLAMPSPGMAVAVLEVTAPDTAQRNATGCEVYGFSVSRN